MISTYSIVAFFIIFFGYIIQSTVLLFYYYYIKGNNKNEWKIQKDVKHIGTKKAPYHTLITTFNLIMASTFSMITAELTLNGYTNIKFTSLHEYGTYYIIQDIMIAILYQSIIEYYWHRIMHLSFFYKCMHKYHHHYKAPGVFDDLYIHPLESFGLVLLLLMILLLSLILSLLLKLLLVIISSCGDHHMLCLHYISILLLFI